MTIKQYRYLKTITSLLLTLTTFFTTINLPPLTNQTYAADQPEISYGVAFNPDGTLADFSKFDDVSKPNTINDTNIYPQHPNDSQQ